MMPLPGSTRAALIAVVLITVALVGFFFFPGHTYLQSDTQIYIPIFERIEHPDLYARDFLLKTSHVGLTVYDETAIGLRKLTGGTFESVLEAEQIVFRMLGLWGVFLIATSIGLSDAAALLVAVCYGLGATIAGPAVLSVEYEPVPRGFAVSFVLLAAGLMLHGRYAWACAAASIGFLYHSPTTIPFWVLLAVEVSREPKRRWRALWPIAIAVVILAATFAMQRGLARPQSFFAVVDPAWEQVLRMRTAYDWIAQWPPGSVPAFVLFCAISLGALWRIRAHTTTTQRILLAGFPLLGLGSIAISAVLLDWWKWALMAQVQPARAALFTIVFAQINCALAGFIAIAGGQPKRTAGRSCEALLWFIPVFTPPIISQFAHGFTFAQAATILLLATLAAILITFDKVRWLAAPVLLAVASWVIPHYAHVVNYSELHSAELDQLSDWARTNTLEQALFVFPASGRNLDQGVFRVKALRSLYTDWKAGGQANYFREFALEWRKRWDELSPGNLTLNDWRSRGVDYLIYEGPSIEKLKQPVFENERYRVYGIPAN
jgi:hypothetical protein